VTDDGLFRIRHNGVTVAEIPGQQLVDEAPVYYPEAKEDEAAVARRGSVPTDRRKADVLGALPVLLDEPSIASKRWVFEQYDSTVQANSLITPGGDAGVFKVYETGFGMAVTVDCNSRLVALDPYEGGKATVAEAARNIACTGAVPLGVTDCLNFGNPERPGIFFQFREACRGISDACIAFNTPVTGGNVSFYNQSPTGAIDPTPTVGMVGLLEKLEFKVGSHFQQTGDRILLLGATGGKMGGSAYWAHVRGHVGGEQPTVDLDAEVKLQRLLAEAARRRLLRSAHDCSTGGIAVALAESAIGGPYAIHGYGAEIDLSGVTLGQAAGGDSEEVRLLYAEDGARAIVSCAAGQDAGLIALAKEYGVPVAAVGAVGSARGEVSIKRGTSRYAWPVEALRKAYFEAIPRRMSHVVEDR
jgi:phosphoribosylformylglycinamidine synthase